MLYNMVPIHGFFILFTLLCQTLAQLALNQSTAAGSVDLQQQQEPLAVKDARNIIQSRLSKAEEAENRGDANPDKRPFDVVLAQGNPILVGYKGVISYSSMLVLHDDHDSKI